MRPVRVRCQPIAILPEGGELTVLRDPHEMAFGVSRAKWL